MNKKIIFLTILISVLWVGGIEAKSYYYDSIEIDIQINEDSTFDVVEKQTYNLDGSFGFFYRDVELKDLDHISNIEVFAGGLSIDKYKVKYGGNKVSIRWDFSRKDFDDELKSWTVKYQVHGGLRFFNNYDELYWNAIFHDRDVVVKKADIVVHLPAGVNPIEVKMFIGEGGSRYQASSYVINDNTVKFTANNILPNEYLTIVVTWPKGAVTKPFLYRNQIINLIVLFLAIFLPFIIFFRSLIIWLRKGKDPKIKKTIIAYYSQPDGLSPASVGVLINQQISTKEVLATIINLAVRGYIRIAEKERKILFFKGKEYSFEKLKSENDLRPFEQSIIRAMFKKSNVVSDVELRGKFHRELPKIKKEIYTEVAQKDLFNENIAKIRKRYGKPYIITIIIGSFIFLSLIILMNILGLSIFSIQLIILWIGLAVASIIGVIFSHQMPVLTNLGLDLKWKSLGFKEYLHTAERFRIEAETLETFSRFLPYAIIFGVEKQWAERFANFSYKEQGWYVPATVYAGQGSFADFSSNLSSFTSSITSSFSPPSSGAGGGGSAGGGGGGGGGGAG